MVTSVIIIDKILTGLIFYPIQIGLQTEKGRFSKGIFGFKIFGLKYISKSLTWIRNLQYFNRVCELWYSSTKGWNWFKINSLIYSLQLKFLKKKKILAYLNKVFGWNSISRFSSVHDLSVIFWKILVGDLKIHQSFSWITYRINLIH